MALYHKMLKIERRTYTLSAEYITTTMKTRELPN